MKEITLKFESEEDYIKFIKEIVIPSVEENTLEFDFENNIGIIKKLEDYENT